MSDSNTNPFVLSSVGMVAMKTKKLLVGYEESGAAEQNEFLAIVLDGEGPLLFGLKSQKTYERGLVVFVGKEVTANDVFARLVDCGLRIESVEQTLNALTAHVEQVSHFKIGNVLEISANAEPPGFKLLKVAERPRGKSMHLP